MAKKRIDDGSPDQPEVFVDFEGKGDSCCPSGTSFLFYVWVNGDRYAACQGEGYVQLVPCPEE